MTPAPANGGTTLRVRFARWVAGIFIAVGLGLIVIAVVLFAGGSSEGGVRVHPDEGAP